MTRVPTLNSPFLLGFDDIERALDRVTRTASDGYPPYNIERIARSETHPEILRITLAVAGFTQDQLEITLEERQLMIRAVKPMIVKGFTCIAALRRGSSSGLFCWQKGCKFWGRI